MFCDNCNCFLSLLVVVLVCVILLLTAALSYYLLRHSSYTCCLNKASDPAQVNKIHWKFTVPPAKVIQLSVMLSFLHCARCFCRRHSHPQHCTCSLALLRLMFATQSFPKYRYHTPLRSEPISCSRSMLEPKESSRRMRCSEHTWAHPSPQLILERRRFHWVRLLVDRMRVCYNHIT